MSYPEKPRSIVWFLLPIFFGIIGGIIAFFILRHDDFCKAKNCLYLGIIMIILGILFNILIVTSIPEMGSDFDVNI